MPEDVSTASAGRPAPRRRGEALLFGVGAAAIVIDCVFAFRAMVPVPWALLAAASLDGLLMHRAERGHPSSKLETIRCWAGISLGLGVAAFAALPGAFLLQAFTGAFVLAVRWLMPGDLPPGSPRVSRVQVAARTRPVGRERPGGRIAFSRAVAALGTLALAALLGVEVLGNLTGSSLLLELGAYAQRSFRPGSVVFPRQGASFALDLPPGHWRVQRAAFPAEIEQNLEGALVDPRSRIEVLVLRLWVPGVGNLRFEEFVGMQREVLGSHGFEFASSETLSSSMDVASVSEVGVRSGAFSRHRGILAAFGAGDRMFLVFAGAPEFWFPRFEDRLRAVVHSFRLNETPPPELDLPPDGGPHPLLVRSVSGWGTAFPVATIPSGCVLATAAHVVGGAPQVEVLRTGRSVRAHVMQQDQELDGALLLAPPPCEEPVQLRAVETLEAGEPVFALGFPRPKGYGPPSLFVRTGRHLDLTAIGGPKGLLPLEMRLDPGHSGGPIVDGALRVIGMAVRRVEKAAAAYALPSDAIVEMIRKKEPGWSPDRGSTSTSRLVQPDFDEDTKQRILQATVVVSGENRWRPGVMVEIGERRFVLSSFWDAAGLEVSYRWNDRPVVVPAKVVRSDRSLGLSILEANWEESAPRPLPIGPDELRLSEPVALSGYAPPPPESLPYLPVLTWGTVASLETWTDRLSVDYLPSKRGLGPVFSSAGRLVAYLPSTKDGEGMQAATGANDLHALLGARISRASMRHRAHGDGGCTAEWLVELDDPLRVATGLRAGFLSEKTAPRSVISTELKDGRAGYRVVHVSGSFQRCPASATPVSLEVVQGEQGAAMVSWIPAIEPDSLSWTEIPLSMSSSSPGGPALSWPDGRPGAGACAGGDVARCERECTKGSWSACLGMGAIVGEVAPDRTHHWIERACRSGAPPSACGVVGDGLLGRHVEEGVEAYRQACRSGDARSCFRIGAIQWAGWTAKPEEDEAIESFLSACRLGEPMGCEVAAIARSSKLRSSLREEDEAAISAACRDGSVASCWNLARSYDGRVLSSRDDRNLPRQAALCRNGNDAACAAAEEIAGKLDQALRSACDQGDAVACGTMGRALVNGERGAPNPEGLRLLRRGCELGSSEKVCDAWRTAEAAIARGAFEQPIPAFVVGESFETVRWTFMARARENQASDDRTPYGWLMKREVASVLARWIAVCGEWTWRRTPDFTPARDAEIPVTVRFQVIDGILDGGDAVDLDPALAPIARCFRVPAGLRVNQWHKGTATLLSEFLVR